MRLLDRPGERLCLGLFRAGPAEVAAVVGRWVLAAIGLDGAGGGFSIGVDVR